MGASHRSSQVSRGLNALALALIGGVLIAALADQFVRRDIPCPLCLLQRAAFIGMGIGFAMNIRFGARPSHYVLVMLGALVGALVAARQVLLHIAPGTGSYGGTVFGLHLYVWAFVLFVMAGIGTAGMLLFEWRHAGKPVDTLRYRTSGAVLMTLFGLIALSNGVLTGLECAAGMCPDNPTGYRWLDGGR